jgi:demethylmenaquinone methyltransferase/2-methoxy-6-polyprenyl-1,4-benzoquinol methylase
MSLHDRIATHDDKRRYVRALFATIADRYDFITVALSYGQDRRWKRRLIDLASPRPGARALDLATGTGDIAFALAARAARVVGLDITLRMIELARGKRGRSPERLALHPEEGVRELALRPRELALRPEEGVRELALNPRELAFHPENGARGFQPSVTFLVGDMLALPFPGASFDIVTTGYGLRNVPDLTAAVDEIGRVLAPGGQVLSLDFNRPSNRLVRAVYLAYLTLVGAALGWILHRDPDTYRYIPASIRQYPGAEAVARLFEARGFHSVRAYPVLGGLMTIHHAVRR